MAVYSELILTIWIVLILAYFIGGAIFLFRLRKTEEEAKQRRRITFLVSIMLISLGLSKLFHLLSVLVIEGHLLFVINQLFLIIALIFIIFSFEKRVTSSTKYILTLSLIITETLYIIFNELSRINTELGLLSQIFSLILAINMVLAGFAILVLYLRITFQATGELYKKSVAIVIGILFLILSFGSFILSDLTPLTEDMVAIISFGCAIISLPFLIFGFL